MSIRPTAIVAFCNNARPMADSSNDAADATGNALSRAGAAQTLHENCANRK